VQVLGQAGGDPFVAAAPEGRGRAGGVFDAAVATAEDQDLDEFVEDQAVGDGPSGAAERVGVGALWQEGGELGPEGFDAKCHPSALRPSMLAFIAEAIKRSEAIFAFPLVSGLTSHAVWPAL
jgi:hypothetical protein